MKARGYRGNELGLARWQVELVHKAAEAVRWRIGDLVRGGMSFADAKAHATRQAQPAWAGLSIDVAEGVRRVVASYQFRDLEPAAKHHCADKFREQVENSRGKPMGRIERVLWRTFGLTF